MMVGFLWEREEKTQTLYHQILDLKTQFRIGKELRYRGRNFTNGLQAQLERVSGVYGVSLSGYPPLILDDMID